MKDMAKRAKWSLKSGILGAKNGLLGFKKDEPATKLESQNGAKCRFCT